MFGVITFLIGLVAAIVFWLFPDIGKGWGDHLIPGHAETLVVPGNNAIERALNKARMEGVDATESSADFAVAIPFVRPSLTGDTSANGAFGNVVALSNVSPLRSTNQDLVFAAGKCRFLGFVSWSGRPALTGSADITGISCVMDNGDAYGFGTPDGSSIGYLAPVDKPGGREIPLEKVGAIVTLPKNDAYVVRLLTPLRDIPFKGKSSITW